LTITGGEGTTDPSFYSYKGILQAFLNWYYADEGEDFAESVKEIRAMEAGQLYDKTFIRRGVTVEVAKLTILDTRPEPLISDGAFGQCPNCRREMNSEEICEDEIPYCPDCGQRFYKSLTGDAYAYRIPNELAVVKDDP
jgi:hypothetical protein